MMLSSYGGNKLDLSENRVVNFDEAKAFAQDEGMLYLEFSAKDGASVNKIFMETAGLIVALKVKGDCRRIFDIITKDRKSVV